MPVSVDPKSIRSQMRRFGEHLLLMARSRPVLDGDLVRAAAVAAMPVESTPWIGSVMVIPAGVVVGLEGEREDLFAFVDRFAAELESRTDAEVTLRAAPDQAWPEWMSEGDPGDESVSVWMAHTLTDFGERSWVVDAETTRLLGKSLDEAFGVPDATWVSIGGELSLDYTGVAIADAAPALVRSTTRSVGFWSARREPLEVYSTIFSPPGMLAVRFGRPAGGVAGLVAAARRLLVALPQTEVYGAALTGQPLYSPTRLPLVGQGDYNNWSKYWDRVVPDAYGMQVLGPEHLERVHDLSGWVTTALDAGRYLVEARDLGAWFDGPVPDPAVQAAARRDFDGVILSAELMAELPVPDAAGRVATAASRGTLGGGNG